MKVLDCPECSAPTVEGYDEALGILRVLELREVPGGPFELVGAGLMRRRLTKAGTPSSGGKGLRLHAAHCPAVIERARIASAAAVKRTNMRGQDVDQITVKPTKQLPPSPPPAVLIELQDALGVEQQWGRPGEEQGTGYVDATGYPLGRAACIACSHPIIVAAHHLRPDGAAPVLLIDKKHRGPWRVYMKDGQGPLAEFTNDRDPLGTHYNHRVICPRAAPRPRKE